MNVLISLKSRIICEALFELLNKDNIDVHFLIENKGNITQSGCPDIIIVDHNSISQKFLASCPDAKVILLDTGLRHDEVITLMLMHKLYGVISTDDDTTLMKKALKLVNEGQIWIGNSHLKALLDQAGNISRSGKVDKVSKREHEILELISQGRKNKEIASLLFMSEQTVKAHVSHIFKKFNVSSRTQLVSHLMNASREQI
jgi:LuxR family transcriptional regulator, positive regulator of biofilm formation